jgi:hypothetical protein
MTLGNMRANGVRTLDAWCLGRGCGHHRVVDVRRYGDDLPVPWFGPRLGRERCGHLGADARRRNREFHRPKPKSSPDEVSVHTRCEPSLGAAAAIALRGDEPADDALRAGEDG